jgi:hypothetical protein
VFGYSLDDPDRSSELDSAAHMPRSVVVDAGFKWSDRPRPSYSYADTVVYEVHVKGFTMTHPEVPPDLRGTYAGLTKRPFRTWSTSASPRSSCSRSTTASPSNSSSTEGSRITGATTQSVSSLLMRPIQRPGAPVDRGDR